MVAARSFLDDPALSSIGRPREARRARRALSPARAALAAVLLAAGAFVALLNLGVFRPATPSTQHGPGATNTPEIQAEIDRQLQAAKSSGAQPTGD